MSTATEALANKVAAESTFFSLRGNMAGALFLEEIAAELRRLAAVEAERDELQAARSRLLTRSEQIEAELDSLRRGECICQRCGLRKDADASGAAPF